MKIWEKEGIESEDMPTSFIPMAWLHLKTEWTEHENPRRQEAEPPRVEDTREGADEEGDQDQDDDEDEDEDNASGEDERDWGDRYLHNDPSYLNIIPGDHVFFWANAACDPVDPALQKNSSKEYRIPGPILNFNKMFKVKPWLHACQYRPPMWENDYEEYIKKNSKNEEPQRSWLSGYRAGKREHQLCYEIAKKKNWPAVVILRKLKYDGDEDEENEDSSDFEDGDSEFSFAMVSEVDANDDQPSDDEAGDGSGDEQGDGQNEDKATRSWTDALSIGSYDSTTDPSTDPDVRRENKLKWREDRCDRFDKVAKRVGRAIKRVRRTLIVQRQELEARQQAWEDEARRRRETLERDENAAAAAAAVGRHQGQAQARGTTVSTNAIQSTTPTAGARRSQRNQTPAAVSQQPPQRQNSGASSDVPIRGT